VKTCARCKLGLCWASDDDDDELEVDEFLDMVADAIHDRDFRWLDSLDRVYRLREIAAELRWLS
jgi:hypothetical protein